MSGRGKSVEEITSGDSVAPSHWRQDTRLYCTELDSERSQSEVAIVPLHTQHYHHSVLYRVFISAPSSVTVTTKQ